MESLKRQVPPPGWDTLWKSEAVAAHGRATPKEAQALRRAAFEHVSEAALIREAIRRYFRLDG